MVGYFQLDYLKTSDYGIVVTGYDTYNVPARKFDAIFTPGHNGAMLVDSGVYDNIDVVYHCSIQDELGLDNKLEVFLSKLVSYNRYVKLVDSYHKNTYRMAYVSENIDVEALRPNHGLSHRAANFDIVFSCRPLKFFIDGDTPITVSSATKIKKDGSVGGYPLLTFNGAGECVINGQSIKVLPGASASVTVDCETMDAYDSVSYANMNKFVELPLDTISLVGSINNNVSVVSGGSVIIKPRWYTL